MAGDVMAVLDALGFDDVDVVGGSLGGGVAIHVDRLPAGPGPPTAAVRAGRFSRHRREARSAAPSPMAAAALRRKVVWPSREAVIHSYGGRPPLDRLAPEALAAYVAWGTLDRHDGQVELACPPAVEAAIFSGGPALRGVHAGMGAPAAPHRIGGPAGR